MATTPKKPRKAKDTAPLLIAPVRSLRRKVLRWTLRGIAGVAAFFAVLVLLFSFLNPPTNIYQLQESARLGALQREWVAIEDMAPVMGRSAVAAEDANFCLHFGFDMNAIRAAVAQGGTRGASTISQQVVKNVFLWHGRSWLRKAMESVLTPAIELVWSKQRILEVYLNIAEFDEGVFGVQAAARHYFNVDARNLSALQAARLAAVLPDPKGRSASNPSNFVRNRTRSIISGAETIAADGRDSCFRP
ncbi:monofunctional biosynthetic peptidoglycan transglycosylase [Pseudorhodobacter sp. MZDSW-24AT]|uniref:monofunctional biosynthetic peptidoglycan transglycosylase n=1 Tax=Pseudorhodobacter sp. MZDSW-24AT TaxID=2052957 RepID=UPI000C1DEBB7|nr:monofunctional biosynthetic peptidoglycan transglycosylase [Pseudorhodobacter sp. MZDSW-24AT]PJF10060.1 monofunctional biosynthetic peptidoglycan transglycosylase [Pseudorhodobacter sp. MZDSW-24AT]